MTRRRGPLEIQCNILEIADKGVNKTRLVYGSNTNFRTIAPHLIELYDLGFITIKGNRHAVYQTTEDGRKFVNSYRDLLGIREVRQKLQRTRNI